MNEINANRFKRICVVRTGRSGDHGAFERALRISLRCGAELYIVSVVPSPPPALLRLFAPLNAAPETLTGEAEQSTEVNKMVEIARQRNVVASGEIVHGSSFSEIIRKVLRDKADLLIKTAEPSTGIQRVLFGHTDRQLIRECPCPVWIEKPSHGISHDKILAAVDPTPFQNDSDADSIRENLNIAILEFATHLAHLEEAELHVVHVWSFPFEGLLESRAGLTEEAVAQVGQAIRQKHERGLDELLRPYRSNIARVHLIKGTGGEEISRVATDEIADVVVMGTMCRSGIGGLLIGNTAETVLDQIDCSIIALKPSGFISPLQIEE
jgi:universal stress protein E